MDIILEVRLNRKDVKRVNENLRTPRINELIFQKPNKYYCLQLCLPPPMSTKTIGSRVNNEVHNSLRHMLLPILAQLILDLQFPSTSMLNVFLEFS